MRAMRRTSSGQVARSAPTAAAASPEEDYPPIGEYAVIGDCHSAALVSRGGSVDWLCLPDFSSPAVFCALLDRQCGGHFRIAAPDPGAVYQRRYLPGSNVLQTCMHTAAGSVRISDCLVLPDSQSLTPQRELLRVVEGVEGEVELQLDYRPRPDFARTRPLLRAHGPRAWCTPFGNQMLLLRSEVPLSCSSGDAALGGRFRVAAGERRVFSLSYTRGDVAVIPPMGEAALGRLQATCDWWCRWSDRISYHGQHRDQVLRSLLTLKLMTFPSGAVVAAPTASLPESVGGVRNWDYRYCWLRDAAMTFRVFSDLGCPAEASSFLGWLLHTTRLTWPELQVLYDVYGEAHLPERELDHLQGYRGSRPVRIGNDAYRQVQLDVYGAVVVAAYNFVRDGGQLDAAEARMLVGLGRCVCRRWRQPDQGIWEIRGEPRHHVHSKLMCWVALDRLLRMQEGGGLPARLPQQLFESQREEIAHAIETRGFDGASNSFVGAFDHDHVDAGLLLLPRYGFVAADDPRMLGTWDRIRRDLGRGALIYRLGRGVDNLPPGEGSFVICGFWAVDYLARLGRIEEAEQRFEALLGLANDLGLLAEEADAAGSALGNFPQAYSHVGLITAALALDEARRHRGAGS